MRRIVREEEKDPFVIQYIDQIKAIPPLSAEVEIELAKVIEAGHIAAERIRTDGENEVLAAEVEAGKAAEKRFIEANLMNVAVTARGYVEQGLSYMDLIQEGSIGIIKALDRWDYTRGHKFFAYAIFWIRQTIERAIDNHARTIRVPVHMQDELQKYREAKQLLLALSADPLTYEALAAEMKVAVKKVMEYERLLRSDHSVMDPFDPDFESIFEREVTESEAEALHNEFEHGLLKEQLDMILNGLSSREAGVISMRFGLIGDGPKTLEEIGQHYGVTRERIRQIEGKTMSKLRHPMRSGVLRDYLDD